MPNTSKRGLIINEISVSNGMENILVQIECTGNCHSKSNNDSSSNSSNNIS